MAQSHLNDKQLRTLHSAVDRMVPADDYPSGSQAGCVDFLLRLIVLESQVEFYKRGLDSIEEAAMSIGQPFSEMPVEDQDQVLYRLERRRKTRSFIETLARQTVEGYYSDPENGGNLGCIASR